MTYSAGITETKCSNCQAVVEQNARFCGNCGFVTVAATAKPEEVAPAGLPSFATAGIPQDSPKTNEWITEANRLSLMLARERLFLIMHWTIFIVVNLFGFWVACKSYVDFHGDEMSKMMVASTPFLFINSLALLSLAPIKGTKNQIALLKERISYLRFNIEFGHVSFRDR
jgi:hypothetical protein